MRTRKWQQRMSRHVINAAASVLLAAVAAGCGPTRPAEFSASAVTQPGKVLVDHDARRIELNSGGEDMCRVWESGLRSSAIPPVIDVVASGDMDARYVSPRDGMMELGAACLKLQGASCRTIVDTMLAWAKADAAMIRIGRDTDDFFDAALTVNLDLARPFIGAYAIARDSVPVAPEDDAAIRRWMQKALARSKELMRGWMVRGENYAAHNGAVASAAALMAYGAMWGDDKAFGHGIDQWFITLGDMRTDGSFPIEARRGARALFYTGRILSGLMSIAEMARVQGIDLYASGPAPEKTIHLAVAFMVAAMDRNEVIHPYAKQNIYPGPSKDWRRQDLGNVATTLSWVIPYTARFPDHPNTIRIQSLRTDRDSDNGAAFNRVLSEGVRVMGHWIGARADCLYRAP